MRNLFISLLAVLVFSSCGKMKAPEFMGIESVETGELGFKKSELKLQLRFFNPNSFKGSVQSAEGEAWIDDVYLGPFTLDSSTQAAAKSEFLVPLTFSVDMRQALSLVKKLARDKKSIDASYMVKLKGKTRAGRSGLYKNFKLNYEGLQQIR